MNNQETIRVLATLKAAYPSYYRGLSNDDYAAVVQLWAVQFSDVAYKDAMLAVHTLISTRTDTFPPVIGEIKEVLRSITHPDETPSGDAWELVMKCIRRGTVHAVEDWEKLPEDVREAVSVDEIKRQAGNEEFNEAVEKSLFFKRWAVLRERRRASDTLPPSLRQQIEARRAALEKVGDDPMMIKAEQPAEAVQKPVEATERVPVDIRAYLAERRR